MSLIARVQIDKYTVTIGQPSPEQFERIMDEYTSYVSYRNTKETNNQTTWENALDTAHWLLASTIKSIKSADNSFKAEYFNDQLTVGTVTDILNISNTFRNILIHLCDFALTNELSLLKDDEITLALGMKVLSVSPATAHH